jgi:hypothetical protein
LDQSLDSHHINRPTAGPPPAKALTFALLLTPPFGAIGIDMQSHRCEACDMTGYGRARDTKAI